MINIGDEVKDKISGYTGIVLDKVEYITGCVQHSVQGENNITPSEMKFDEIRLEVISIKKLQLKKTYKAHNQFELGDNVIEVVSNFSGIITGVAYSITGMLRYLVYQDNLDEKERPDSYWIDSVLLKKLSDKKIILKDDNEEISGFCEPVISSYVKVK